MRSAAILALMIATPVSMGSVQGSPPIAGSWQADRRIDILGPTSLTITSQSIAFGPNSEKLTRWFVRGKIVTIETAAGHSYTFRRDTESRICLLSNLREANLDATKGAVQLRCYTKRSDG